MSDDQKIWFIYLTDHHEGPFTAAEIAEKSKAGLVSGQSLAWKDGMPEWVAAETIPELAGAVSNVAAPAMSVAGDMAAALPAAGGEGPAAGAADGEVSLAQLLANSQKGAGTTTTGTESGQIADSASVLSSMVSSVHAASPVTTQTGVSIGGGTGTPAAAAMGEPGLEQEVWTLKIGGQVSGLHSLRRLKELAAAGEVPPDAMVWHSGWSDFQSVRAVAHLEASLKAAKGGARAAPAASTRTGIHRPTGVAMSAMSNNALDNDEEPTDTGIERPPPGGFQGILFRVHTFFENFKKKKKAPAKGVERTKETAAPAKGKGAAGAAKKPLAAAGKGGAAKRIVMILLLLVVLAGGGGAAYFFLLSSPIPSAVDVSDDDRESMVAVVQAKDGHKLFLALAKGTEENPPDPTTPKYFVASNLPEGTTVTLTVTGIAGKLVNRLSFEKVFTAPIEKGLHVAIFDKISDEGKPLWGEFDFKVTAPGADPLDGGKHFIGNKGAAYQKRLKTYIDSVQGDYDKEVTELREYITTLKNLQVEASKEIADYKTGWAVPANRAKLTADWATYAKNSQALIAQLDTNLKARQAGDKQPKFHARAFQDVATTVGQLDQLVKVHGDRLGGATPTANADELDGLVQAGVQALEAWLAQAVSKSPFDTKPAESAKPAPAAGAAPPPAAAASAATPAPAAPAPAAAAPAPTAVKGTP